MKNKENCCKFQKAWVGQCDKPIVENGMCAEHAKEKCVSCGAPATHTCEETGQFVCGAPLCDDCEHTTAMEGTNGNIGFFRTSPLPEGMKEHCKKCDQKVFPWYVTSLAKDHPFMAETIERFNKGELTYINADKLMSDFCAKLNEEDEKRERQEEKERQENL